MNKLPQYSFNEGFYIWFNADAKEEYYSTPLYMYKTQTIDDLENKKRKIIQEKNFYKHKPSKKLAAPKHPSTILFPFAEQFGLFLISLLNADFSSFDGAYNTFFYLYGFELLKEYIPDKELMGTYSSEEELETIMKRVYEDSSHKLMDIQYDFRKCVDFIYNLNGNEELKDYKPSSKFIASLVTRKNNVYSYSSDIEVILDTYSDKYEKYGSQSLEELTKELDKNNAFIKMANVYTSKKLSNIAFVVLEQITNNYNLPIKKCQHCGRYFMPSIRQDELYCDLPNEDGKSCREKGAKQAYREKLEKDPVLQEYRKAYQKKFMEVSRSNGDKQKKEDFEEWKTVMQEMLKNYKEEKAKEKENSKLMERILKWIDENK